MKILFLSRAYPPILGGIENQNFGIAKNLAKIASVKIIANRKGKKNLPFFLPAALIKGIWFASRYDVLLVGDGVLAPIALIVKFFYPKIKTVSIVHGLDITFANKKSILGGIYRLINIPALRKIDLLIMVGNETINKAVDFGCSREKCVFIPNGVDPAALIKKHSRQELEKLLGMNLEDKKVILRFGRYVRHKGLLWFIQNVMTKLPDNYVLVAAGGVPAQKTAGDENIYPECVDAVKKFNLSHRVKLLKNVSEEDKLILLNTADLMVSPNISVPGSLEGFGINVIEGSVCSRVVLAADIGGLKDAVVDGKNGFLLKAEDAALWIQKIKEILSNQEDSLIFSENAKRFTIDNFSWEVVARRYLDEISALIKKK